MYINSKDRKNVIGEIVINFGRKLGLEEEEDAFIKLRDMNVGEAVRFKTVKDDEASQYEEFKKVLPNLITDHNFFEDEEQTQKMSNEEVVDVIYDTWLSAQFVYNTFLGFMFRRVQ